MLVNLGIQAMLIDYAKLSDVWCCVFLLTAGVTGLILCIVALTPHAKNKLQKELSQAENSLNPILEQEKEQNKKSLYKWEILW